MSLLVGQEKAVGGRELVDECASGYRRIYSKRLVSKMEVSCFHLTGVEVQGDGISCLLGSQHRSENTVKEGQKSVYQYLRILKVRHTHGA